MTLSTHENVIIALIRAFPDQFQIPVGTNTCM